MHLLDSYCEKILVWVERNPELELSSIIKKTHACQSRLEVFSKLVDSDSKCDGLSKAESASHFSN